MEQRTIVRFRKRSISLHWLHTAPFSVLLITGALMFFDLTGLRGGRQIRIIHQAAAAFFVIVPILYSLLDPRAALSFVKEAFRWSRDDLAWLRSSPRFYFGRKVQMPPQGYLNGDQRLWQLIVLVTGLASTVTGVLMWFFKLKMPRGLYQWISLSHAAAFVVVLFMFMLHFYLTTLHPDLGESLGAMLDGKVSPAFAREHYRKWYEEETGAESAANFGPD